MSNTQSTNSSAHEGVISLAEEILADLELDRIPLTDVYLKAARLFRFINKPGLVIVASKDAQNVKTLEAHTEAAKLQLTQAADPPGRQRIGPIDHGNVEERSSLRNMIVEGEKGRQEFKNAVYRQMLDILYRRKFSGVPRHVFDSIQRPTEERLTKLAPEAMRNFIAAYDNLKFENPANWSNAVHSCRKILIAVADKLFPPSLGGKAVTERGGQEITVGQENWINRLVCWIEDQSSNSLYSKVIGSTVEHIGNRLDAINGPVQTGTHEEITDLAEAERYVVYTYLLLADILSLIKEDTREPTAAEDTNTE